MANHRLHGCRVALAAVLSILVLSTVTAQDSAAGRQGPYERLAIVNAMVIPGHGGPAYGPAGAWQDRYAHSRQSSDLR